MTSYDDPTHTSVEPGSPPPPYRRRGPVLAAVGAVTVLAVAAPLALTGGDLFGGSEVAVAPAPATPTPDTDQGHRPPAGVLDASDLPTGAAPGVPYVAAGVLHEPDGSTAEVGTRYPVREFAVLADGSRVWQTARGGTSYVEVQGADGTLGDPVRSEFGLGVNPAHTVAAWVTPSGQVMVWGGGDAAPTTLGDPITAGHDLRVGAVTGDDCSQSCSVIVNAFGAQSESGWQPWEVSVNGTEPLRDGRYLVVNDISRAGLTIGYRKLDDLGSCSALLGGGELQGFATCRHTLASFSPDGQLVLADPAYHDGIGNGVIAMYDLAGHRLFESHSTEHAQAFYPTAQWEDTTHALAPVFQDGRWAVVRFADDGAMEYAVEPVAGKDVRDPFVLAIGGPAA